MKEENKAIRPRGSALIPFLVFVSVYMGTSIALHLRGTEMAFYQLPTPVAILPAIIVAFLMFRGGIEEKFDQFVTGCGNSNIITMCCVYLLAGGFASVAGAMGGVQSTANLGLSIIPPQYITGGLFVIAMFLSLAAGTSVGTIGAIVPIAVEVAATANLNTALVLGAVVGGAMFGDNLSMISDTTIAATKTQGVEMRDKFRVNLLIALPAAVITFVLLMIFARPESVVPMEGLEYSVIKVIPYLLVLALALLGVNVFVTLMVGILSAIAIGLGIGELTVLGSMQDIYAGFTGMFEIFLLSMLTGGLSQLVTANGGVEWLLIKIKSFIKSKRSAEAGIAAIVSLADVAVANNTVAIVLTGPVVKEISTTYKVDPRRSASLLDTWSCVWQGIIPYGAQILIACSLTAGAVSPVELLPHLWYPYLLGIFAVLSMFVPFADGLIKKSPWDWEKGRTGSPKQADDV